MIRNVLFDMGGVLLRFEPHVFIRRYNVTEEDETILYREVFRSPEWVMNDRGIIDDDGLLERVLVRIPDHLNETAEDLVRHWDEPRIIMEGAEEMLRELQEAGYHLYLLTNASLRHHEYWPKCSVSSFFEDRIFLSADHRLLKPSAEYFEEALRTFGLNREECIFIDDSPANAEGALFCGIRALVFHGDYDDLRRKLRREGLTF